MKLIFVTGNENKFKEARSILPSLEKHDLDLTEIQSLSSKEVIEHKLNEARKINSTDHLIVEDNSLLVDGLNGLPGPLIKWFMKSVDCDGLVKIAKNMGNLSAQAIVTIGYSSPEGDIHFFEGIVEGSLTEPKGDNGFGWDKIFVPSGQDKTYAQMSFDDKNNISSRKLAFEKLKEHLSSVLE